MFIDVVGVSAFHHIETYIIYLVLLLVYQLQDIIENSYYSLLSVVTSNYDMVQLYTLAKCMHTQLKSVFCMQL